MTDLALSNYKEAQENRIGRNDARRIQAERDKARSPTSGAARRWPFELLQNAHDPGPRQGSSVVNIRLSASDSRLVFQHNGRAFTMDDLTALLSGGSNKEYQSVDTTGQFGTGFLVTHVLSPKINLSGILDSEAGHERFQINLDRSGDESTILENIKAAESDIQAAEPVQAVASEWTAEFQYPVDNQEAVAVGVDEFRRSVPYLYGTCHYLGDVTIEAGDHVAESWHPVDSRRYERAGVRILEQYVTLRDKALPATFRILRLMPASAPDDADIGLVVVLRSNEAQWRFVPAPLGLPRIFARFPIRTSAFLPINCVIDGRFDVQEERDRIGMKDCDQARMAAGLELIPAVVELAVEEKWQDCQQLARVAEVETAFSEDRRADELDWWNQELRKTAGVLAQMPLVKTAAGYLPAIAAQSSMVADFVLPRYSRTVAKDEIAEERVWDLSVKTTILRPPVRELLSEWNELTDGWESLGISVRRMGLKEIAEKMRENAKRIDELPVDGDPQAWLADYMDVLGELPAGHDCNELLEGLLPNQDGELCSAAALKRDDAIPNELKDIAELIGLGVRKRLFDAPLAGLGMRDGYRFIQAFIAKSLPGKLAEDDVLHECIDRLSRELPDGQKPADHVSELIEGSVRLLAYIWATHGEEGADLARRCPLLTRDKSIAHYSPKKIMAPVSAWHQEAQSFAEIYAPSRVLADVYHDRSTEECDVVGALVAWGIAFPDPIIKQKSEVDEQLLRALVLGDTDTQGLTVRDEFSQVALLSTEVIQRCEDHLDRATLLLGFVLKYLAPNDPAWRRRRRVVAKRGTEEVTLEIREALWVAELKRRAWVPMETEEGNQKVMPSPASLGPLLRDEWLVSNDPGIEFLIECFGFEVLSLRLQALPEKIKEEVSGRLAELVEIGGSDPSFYQQLVENLQMQRKRQQEKERNKKFGLAVQAAIEEFLREIPLNVQVIDRGYDLEVDVPEEVPLIEAGTHVCSVGPYLVEIKATTSGYVRLTPAQARIASQCDQFVLCVVDLRKCGQDRLFQPWTACDVEPLARIITDLRDSISETHSLVKAATEQEIAIQNESKLRYVVPTQIWERGKSIKLWVKEIAPTLDLSA